MTTTLNYASKLLFGTELSSDLPSLPGSGTQLIQVADDGTLSLTNPVSAAGSANAVQVSDGAGGFVDSGVVATGGQVGFPTSGNFAPSGNAGVNRFGSYVQLWSNNSWMGFQNPNGSVLSSNMGYNFASNTWEGSATTGPLIDTRIKRVSAGTVGVYQSDGTTRGTIQAANLLVNDFGNGLLAEGASGVRVNAISNIDLRTDNAVRVQNFSGTTLGTLQATAFDFGNDNKFDVTGGQTNFKRGGITRFVLNSTELRAAGDIGASFTLAANATSNPDVLLSRVSSGVLGLYSDSAKTTLGTLQAAIVQTASSGDQSRISQSGVSIKSDGALRWGGNKSQITSPSDGTVLIQNFAGTALGTLQAGTLATTNAYQTLTVAGRSFYFEPSRFRVTDSAAATDIGGTSWPFRTGYFGTSVVVNPVASHPLAQVSLEANPTYNASSTVNAGVAFRTFGAGLRYAGMSLDNSNQFVIESSQGVGFGSRIRLIPSGANVYFESQAGAAATANAATFTNGTTGQTTLGNATGGVLSNGKLTLTNGTGVNNDGNLQLGTNTGTGFIYAANGQLAAQIVAFTRNFTFYGNTNFSSGNLSGTHAQNIGTGDSPTFESTGIQEGAADPTTADIPTDTAQVWRNTTSGEVRHWVNDGGTMKKSAAYT